MAIYHFLNLSGAMSELEKVGIVSFLDEAIALSQTKLQDLAQGSEFEQKIAISDFLQVKPLFLAQT